MAAYEQGEEWLNQLLVYLSGNMRFIREFCAEHLPELKPNTEFSNFLHIIHTHFLFYAAFFSSSVRIKPS